MEAALYVKATVVGLVTLLMMHVYHQRLRNNIIVLPHPSLLIH